MDALYGLSLQLLVDTLQSLVRGSATDPCSHPHAQASAAGADEALMLDPHGFVATCNSTNFFIIRSHIDIRGERQCQVGGARIG